MSYKEERFGGRKVKCDRCGRILKRDESYHISMRYDPSERTTDLREDICESCWKTMLSVNGVKDAADHAEREFAMLWNEVTRLTRRVTVLEGKDTAAWKSQWFVDTTTTTTRTTPYDTTGYTPTYNNSTVPLNRTDTAVSPSPVITLQEEKEYSTPPEDERVE